ncbi:flavodoxin family protein [Actinoplanes xinjiangensis]|uniref:flavodoxin family protein n=1 Tax=Actinoplanes xinjiangensis TaxID=512350 RepID=UPI0034158B0F
MIRVVVARLRQVLEKFRRREETVMKALVVFESVFGNTEAIARAIAEGLEPDFDVTVADVHTMPAIGDADLIVVGAPTHAFSASRPRTRTHTATTRARAIAIGVREYLEYAPWSPGVYAAAFDVRLKMPTLPGSGARKVYRRLRGLGCHMVAPAEPFHVTRMTGPLADGERDRARQWARTLAGTVFAGTATTRIKVLDDTVAEDYQHPWAEQPARQRPCTRMAGRPGPGRPAQHFPP